MDLELHWKEMYRVLAAGMATGGHDSVPLLHVDSSKGTSNVAQEPPYVIFTQETFRNLGSTSGGNLKVISDQWRVVARHRDLTPVLDYISAIITELEKENNTFATVDGYDTTAIEFNGLQTFYEEDSKLNAAHLRFTWERSK